MSVEISYRVINLDSVGPFVKMNLEAIRTVPPEEIERARREAEHEPEIDVVDEDKLYQKLNVRPKPKTQMEEVFSALRTQFPEFAEMLKSGAMFPAVPGGVVPMRVVPLFNQTAVLLTPEQYAEMGSPPLLSTIRVVLNLQ